MKSYNISNSITSMLLVCLLAFTACRKEIDTTYNLNITSTHEIAANANPLEGELSKSIANTSIQTMSKQQGFSIDKIKSAHVKSAEVVIDDNPIGQGFESFDWLEVWIKDETTNTCTKVATKTNSWASGTKSIKLELTNEEVSTLIRKENVYIILKGKSNQTIAQPIHASIKLGVEFDAILFNK